MTRRFKAIITRDSESGWFVGEIEGLPGCYSQAPDLPTLRKNLREAILAYLGTPEPDDPNSGAAALRVDFAA